MRLKQYIFGFMAMLAMITGMNPSLLAAKKHKSGHSSSHKKEKHSKSKHSKTNLGRKTKLLKEIKEITKEDLVIDKKTHCAVEKILDCACTCNVIRAEDFADSYGHHTQTYVIREPGKYCLAEDVAFKPLHEFTAAIKILSSDVTLDLGEHTLSQSFYNNTPNAYGVLIGQGYNYSDPDLVLKNITIENGNIINFTGIGVFCYNGSFDEPSAQLPFQDLHFFNLNILDCGSYESTDFASGINLGSNAIATLYDLDFPVAFKNIIVENCNVNRCLGNGAINIYTADDVVIRNTHANECSNNGSPLGFVAGFDIACRNLQMYECQANGTGDFDETNTSGAAIGGYIVNSINVYIKDCQFNDTYGAADIFVGGADFSNNQNAIYEDCQFNDTRGGPGIIYAAGVDISDAHGQQTKSKGVKFINCQFNGTSVDSRNPGGVFDLGIFGVVALTLQDIVFEDCQACNIVTENPKFAAFGYWVGTESQDSEAPFAHLHNVTFSNCIASDICGGADTAGFAIPADHLNRTGPQGSQTNIVFEQCIAEHIHSKSHGFPVTGIGEYSHVAPASEGPITRMTNLLIKECRVSDVRGGCSNPLSAGILVRCVHNPMIIGNTVCDCDRGILLTGINHNGLIQENKVENCTISCYQDDACITSSAWVNNTAFNCGHPASVPPCSKTNYNINFSGDRPVDVGSLDNYPRDGHKYYNLSLVPFGPPCPPKDFEGKLSNDSHSTSDSHHIIHIHWKPSPSKDVVAYHIYKEGELIKTVPACGPHRFKISTHSTKQLCSKYKITAVSSNHIESKAVHLKVEEVSEKSSSSSASSSS